MFPQSSPVKSFKPALNPSALSFEPAQSDFKNPQNQNEIRLPHETYHHDYQDPFLYGHQPHETYINHYQHPFLYGHQPQVAVASVVFWHPSPVHHQGFEYCTPPPSWNYGGDQYLPQYDSQAQSYPHLHADFGITLGNSEVYMGIRKKQQKKAKCGFVPPRLRLLREKPVHGQTEILVPKKVVYQKTRASSDGEEQAGLDGKTSLMIRNIPNQWRRVDLQHKVDAHCRKMNGKARKGSDSCRSAYDFLYVPIDFGFGRNLGYAFVNFTTPEAASRFSKAFRGMKWASGDKTKRCEITSADHQGRKALEQKHQRSTFACHTKSYLPVVYSPARDGFNNSKPITVGRCTYVSVHSNEMIMTRRKEIRKAA